MSKVTVRVVKAFDIYNAGDVVSLGADELRRAGANVRPVDAPGSNRLGPAPSSLRDVVSDGEAAAGGAAPREAEIVTAPPKPRSRKKRE